MDNIFSSQLISSHTPHFYFSQILLSFSSSCFTSFFHTRKKSSGNVHQRCQGERLFQLFSTGRLPRIKHHHFLLFDHEETVVTKSAFYTPYIQSHKRSNCSCLEIKYINVILLGYSSLEEKKMKYEQIFIYTHTLSKNNQLLSKEERVLCQQNRLQKNKVYQNYFFLLILLSKYILDQQVKPTGLIYTNHAKTANIGYSLPTEY